MLISPQDPWIRKIGYPVLTVAEEPGQIGVRQSRFLQTGDVKAEEDETLWWVPLGLKTDPEATGAATTALVGPFHPLFSDSIGRGIPSSKFGAPLSRNMSRYS